MNPKTIKIDDQIIKKLGVNEIRRIICNTDKGVLELMIRKGENHYFLTMDSVPLDPILNKELMDILFKVEIPQVKTEMPVAKGKTIKKIK